MRDILQRIRKSKGGFTLVELMVTMVLVGLLIGASAAGIFYYQKWSVWQRQEHYAKTLFLAAQSGMTQYSADKRLEQFEKTASESATAIVRQNQLLIPVTDENGQTVSVSEIWKNDSQTSSDLDSDLYYVTGTPSDYQAYKSGNADAAHELLYDIFDSYLYDKTLLSDGCVSVEFDAHDGLVYSVLYSDRADALSYGSCTNTTANIINRSTANRKGSGSENSTGLCFGYYGADSLSKSNDASSKVKISSVSLNNEETLNVTWTSSSDEAGVSQMGYQVMIVDAKTGEELLEISLNDPSLRGQKSESGYYYSIPAESADDSLKLVAAQVTSFADGKRTELGTYPFLAYIDENLQVTLVLDAVDLAATQSVYETYRRTGEPGALVSTLSLHRFGLETYGVDEIRCIVQGGGSGYQITGRKQSNAEPMYFASQSKKIGSDTKDDGAEASNIADNKVSEQNMQETDSNQKIYEIQNARHLYNIRFAEIVTDAAVYAADADEKSGNNYVITKDFAWGYEEPDESTGDVQDETTKHAIEKDMAAGELISGDDIVSKSILKKGMVYRNGLSVTDADTAFPMITQLREGSSLGSLDVDDVHTISYLTLSDAANAGTGSSNRFYPQGTGTALILENLGEIHDLSLYHASVNGDDYVATFCAYNGGRLENLETVGGTITAQNYAGGIFAASLPMKQLDDGALIKLVNHATVTAKVAAGIVAESSEPIVLADCVNTGVITGSTAAGITTVENEDLTIIGCQNYGVILSEKDEGYGITSNQTASLTDCVGVSDPTYPIAADATEAENCWYFVSGEETLNQLLKGGISDISLTIGEADRTGAYREQAFMDVTKEQITHLIKQDATDVPVFKASSFDIDESRYPIYNVRLDGSCKLSDLTLTWLGDASYQFDLWYADVTDGNWKLLETKSNAQGGADTHLTIPEGTQASALKIVVTDVTEDCDVVLGGIILDGSWQTEGVALEDRLEDERLEEDSKESADTKTGERELSDSDQGESLIKGKGVGTALYVKKEGELTESDEASLYTKWIVPAGSLSISPLLLNTEEAKIDQDDENIRVRVWEKLRDELADLSMFEIEEPEPSVPSGITVVEQADEITVAWQPGPFAEKYEYEISSYAYKLDENQNPVQTENGNFETVLLGTDTSETKEPTLTVSSFVNGTSVDCFVIRVRSVNQIGSSDWVIYQTADEQLQLPTPKYHLKLSSVNNINGTVSGGSEKIVGYELVIDNKDEYQALVFDTNRHLTVRLNTDSGFATEFSLDQTGTIFVSDEETVTISCSVSSPGYQTSAVSEKTFSVLNAQTVWENQAVFDAKLKPDQESIGFGGEDGSLYQIATGHAKKEKMQLLAAFETIDEALQVPVLYQANQILGSDEMETTAFEVGDFYKDDQFVESAFVVYPIVLGDGAVELGHIVSDNLSVAELLEAYVTSDGKLSEGTDSATTRLIQSGVVADGYAILAGEDGYQLYYSPLLKNSTLASYSSSEQSLYGVWRYALTEEERNVRKPEESSSEEETSSEEESSSEEQTSSEEESSSGVETTAPEETTPEETTVPEETSPQETTSEEETTPQETESEPESESESESESETDPEPVQLTAPSLSVSDGKQEFLYPIFDKDENGNWKDSQRKTTASQSSIYFDVDAEEEGCAGYELSMISFVKTKQIGRNQYEYRDALTFQLVKDDSKAGFHISGMLSTKSDGYTMDPKDTEGGLVELYQMYTDQENGIYTYLLPYYVECENKQEKVLVYAWLKQTNETDEEGKLLSTRFELFVPDGAAPLGEQYAAAVDSAVVSVQAIAQENQGESDGNNTFLDSNVSSLSRVHGSDAFQKNEEPKKELNDSFSDATVSESQNEGFAYAFAEGSGTSEYLVKTSQWRTTKAGERNCTYRLLPVYWKYDEQGINKQYFIYLPENGFAMPYYEQVNGNEPYLLYHLSICFAKMDETGLSDWSKESASVDDGDPKTFVLENSSSLGHLNAPKLTYNQQEDSASYPLTDENGQTAAQIQAKIKMLSWSWNSDWDKLSGFETTLFFVDQNGQTKELYFVWNYEEWLKDWSSWSALHGSSLLQSLTIREKKEENSEEFSEEATTEKQTLPEADSSEQTTSLPTIEPVTEASTSEQVTQDTTPSSQTEGTTPELTQIPEEVQESVSETVVETQFVLPVETMPETTMPEEVPVPVSDEASIQRKQVILRLTAPLAGESFATYLFDVKAVLTVKTTPLSDGSFDYEFTLEIPQEIIGADYTDEEGETPKIMQLTQAQIIARLKNADSPYYPEIKLEK